MPNISPDKETGIGTWTTLDFVNAMKRGIAPGGVHLYPAFPYTSYQRMTYEDLIDLKAYLDTLPAVQQRGRRRTRSTFLTTFAAGSACSRGAMSTARASRLIRKQSAEVNRGAYLVLGPGHCAECHSPRDVLRRHHPVQGLCRRAQP